MEEKTPEPLESSKAYDLSFEHRPEYLYAFVTGEKDSYDISKQFWLEIAAECRKSEYQKVLIEEDIRENVSMSEMYRFASEIPRLGFFGIRVAFVDLRREQRQLNKFGETVATNRGLFSRVFDTADEAERWLLSEGF